MGFEALRVVGQDKVICVWQISTSAYLSSKRCLFGNQKYPLPIVHFTYSPMVLIGRQMICYLKFKVLRSYYDEVLIVLVSADTCSVVIWGTVRNHLSQDEPRPDLVRLGDPRAQRRLLQPSLDDHLRVAEGPSTALDHPRQFCQNTRTFANVLRKH